MFGQVYRYGGRLTTTTTTRLAGQDEVDTDNSRYSPMMTMLVAGSGSYCSLGYWDWAYYSVAETHALIDRAPHAFVVRIPAAVAAAEEADPCPAGAGAAPVADPAVGVGAVLVTPADPPDLAPCQRN